MSDARSTVLRKIRAAMHVTGSEPARTETVAARLADHPTGIVPMRGQLPRDARIALFETMATTFNATVTRITGYREAPAVVAGYLRERNLPAAIRMGADPHLAEAGFDTEKTLEIRHGASDGQDLSGVSHAFAGIAETGTLALLSGPDNPTTINFLPEHHIVLVHADDIAGDLESVFAKLRASGGQGAARTAMPRALNLVTGPSRSGDIEQTILLGAHGPRALHIIIVE